MELEDDLCMLLSVMQKFLIIRLKTGVSRSNIAANPPVHSEELWNKAGFIALDAYMMAAAHMMPSSTRTGLCYLAQLAIHHTPPTASTQHQASAAPDGTPH